MQLSNISIDTSVDPLRCALKQLDVDVLSGADASLLVDVLSPLRNQLDATLLALSARAIATNQHNLDGSRSGAAWIAAKVGVSEKRARSDMATQSALRELPDVEHAVLTGEISLEKASIITRAAEGNGELAAALLSEVGEQTVEMLARKARELRVQSANDHRHERLRKSQYVNVAKDQDGMVCGSFRLLPEKAMVLWSAYHMASGETTSEQAESFAQLLAGNSFGNSGLVFHVDLTSNRFELEGIGPVSREALDDEFFSTASRILVGTADNKLIWFSEQNRRSTTAPLPEYIKRAVRLNAYGECEAKDCTNPVDQVDHLIARCNQGTNHLENLQALCAQCHAAKTTKDAEWTAGGIYAKTKQQRRDERRRRSKRKRWESTSQSIAAAPLFEKGEPSDC